eukprot:9500172-Pyramimonas_sp.AAC.1
MGRRHEGHIPHDGQSHHCVDGQLLPVALEKVRAGPTEVAQQVGHVEFGLQPVGHRVRLDGARLER